MAEPQIGHFQIPHYLAFKTWLSENQFYLHDNKKLIFISKASHLASL